ncbi:MAG: hypothetical protein GY913_33055 [Proteobacteria bacterium]|nr:hypothetical protein [Pseudomonadota bacterium]MCP4921754.1 hypothetical protein [Pseudomonadota bacterium]
MRTFATSWLVPERRTVVRLEPTGSDEVVVDVAGSRSWSVPAQRPADVDPAVKSPVRLAPDSVLRTTLSTGLDVLIVEQPRSLLGLVQLRFPSGTEPEPWANAMARQMSYFEWKPFPWGTALEGARVGIASTTYLDGDGVVFAFEGSSDNLDEMLFLARARVDQRPTHAAMPDWATDRLEAHMENPWTAMIGVLLPDDPLGQRATTRPLDLSARSNIARGKELFATANATPLVVSAEKPSDALARFEGRFATWEERADA